MKLKDMTLKELAEYEEIPTARPRTDMVLVKDLRKWAKIKVKEIDKKRYDLTGMKFAVQRLEDLSVTLWIIDNFNLEDK